MKQLELIDDKQRLCMVKTLEQGIKAVKANRGSPGIDGVTIEEYE